MKETLGLLTLTPRKTFLSEKPRQQSNCGKDRDTTSWTPLASPKFQLPSASPGWYRKKGVPAASKQSGQGGAGEPREAGSTRLTGFPDLNSQARQLALQHRLLLLGHLGYLLLLLLIVGPILAVEWLDFQGHSILGLC